MVLVPFKHAGDTIHVGLGPFGRVAEQIPIFRGMGSVGLQVGLVHYVEAKPITKAEESGIVRIVAGTNGIDIVTLHDIEITEHMIHRCCRAENGMAVMAVHALCLHLLAVDINDTVHNTKILQSYILADILTSAVKKKGIQIGGSHRSKEREIPL